ncbi:MAG: pilin [Oscillospiraceae bacterium]|nr:pilin [Oscillospiraceae bacterium]
MLNLTNLLLLGTTTGPNPFTNVVRPIVALLNMVVAPAMLIVGALGSIYCIILGVKFAKAEEQQDRDKAKKSLQNALIGFISIFVLIAILRLGIPAMEAWLEFNAPARLS